jgi:hypothetical protein
MSRISEQEEIIDRIRLEAHRAQQTMEEERRIFALSNEGTHARIRYLEGMMRSLQAELRDMERNIDHEAQGSASTPRPVFLRDLTIVMRDTDTRDEGHVRLGATTSSSLAFPCDDPTCAIRNVEHPRHECPMGDVADEVDEDDDRPYSDDGADDTASLREQIVSLGNSLADSEIRRADMLDDFQRERQEYIAQYERLSEVLKALLEGRDGAVQPTALVNDDFAHL